MCQERGAKKILLFRFGFIPDREKQRQLFPPPHQKHRGGGEADRLLLRPDALPDCLIGLGLQALATNTLGLLVKQGLDANGRPKAFYKNVHMNCPHLSAFEAGHMVKTMSDKDGCRFSMGCKGPRSACDSFERKWNNGVNWCVNNATCIGCTSPTFPDGQSPFYVN